MRHGIVRESKNIFEALAVFIGLAALFMSFVSGRILELDSGFYVMAAKFVAEGKPLYEHFFFPQMPLMPYLYGFVMKLFGYDWDVARIFSALVGASAGTLLYLYLRAQFGVIWALGGTLLFATSNLSFPWVTTVKSYPLSELFIIGAVAALYSPRAQKLSLTRIWIAACCAAFAFQTRLYLAVLAPLLLLFVIRQSGVAEWRRASAVFIGAFFLACIPTIAIALNDPELFWFNNVGYHLMRSDVPEGQELAHKLKYLRVLLGIEFHSEVPRFQFQILLAVSLGYSAFQLLKRVLPDKLTIISMVLLVVSFVPTPVYPQYFCLAVPGLIVGTIGASRSLIASTSSFTWASLFRLTFICMLGYQIAMMPGEWERFTRTGVGVPGVGNPINAATWSIASTRLIAQAVREHTEPGEYVLANWTGFLLETEALPYPGTENRFGIKTANNLPEERKKRYGIISYRDTRKLIKNHQVRLIIEGDPRGKPEARKSILKHGYKVVLSAGRNRVYVRAPLKE